MIYTCFYEFLLAYLNFFIKQINFKSNNSQYKKWLILKNNLKFKIDLISIKKS